MAAALLQPRDDCIDGGGGQSVWVVIGVRHAENAENRWVTNSTKTLHLAGARSGVPLPSCWLNNGQILMLQQQQQANKQTNKIDSSAASAPCPPPTNASSSISSPGHFLKHVKSVTFACISHGGGPMGVPCGPWECCRAASPSRHPVMSLTTASLQHRRHHHRQHACSHDAAIAPLQAPRTIPPPCPISSLHPHPSPPSPPPPTPTCLTPPLMSSCARCTRSSRP